MMGSNRGIVLGLNESTTVGTTLTWHYCTLYI